MIAAQGRLWQNQRKHLHESLGLLGMKKFQSESKIFLDEKISFAVKEFIEIISSKITSEIKTNILDPSHFLHDSLGSLMFELVFGVKFSKKNPTWNFLKHLQEEGVKYIGISGPVNFLPFLRILPTNRKILKFLLEGKKKTHDIYDEIIQECSHKLDSYPISILKLFYIEKMRLRAIKHADLKYFTQEQLKHLLADCYGAGVDTTLTTILWFILYTAKYTEIQEKLRREMIDFPSINDMNSMILMKATIAEVQRIRTVVPLGE